VIWALEPNGDTLMSKALFLNGVFEEVLEEILEAQASDENLYHFLQPYSGQVIKLLEKYDFETELAIPFYISTTTNLNSIVYVAEIIGWENKKNIGEQKLSKYNEQIAKSQPIQERVYFYSDKEEKRECINLIFIKSLVKLTNNIPTSILVKTSDELPLRTRTRAGGWSVVESISPKLLNAREFTTKEAEEKRLSKQVSDSFNDTQENRQKRLRQADKIPEVMQVLSIGFKRNSDVVTEVLQRANGVCERCQKEAPFLRRKDNTPYLEVHHTITLANGGEDTVENAVALCPNCHRKVHFGI